MRFLAKTLFFLLLISPLAMSGCSNAGNEMQDGLADRLERRHYFTLNNLEGQTISLEALLKEKKALLINFFATWCPPCQEEIPDLIELQARYSLQGFTVIGVDTEESQKKVASFAKKFKINYPVLLDRDASVAAAYGIVGIPTTYLIDSAGNVLGEYHGFTRKLVSDVERALR